MKEIITLRQILNTRFPKGSRLFSKKNSNSVKSERNNK